MQSKVSITKLPDLLERIFTKITLLAAGKKKLYKEIHLPRVKKNSAVMMKWRKKENSTTEL